MSFIKEFKEFAMRGNVVDLAVGIVIGGAFGKIVSSFVADVIMPPIGVLIGGVKFTDLKITLKNAVLDETGKEAAAAVTLNIGNFIQTVFDFTIIAFAIFLLIKTMNTIKARQEKSDAAAAAAIPPAPAEPTAQEKLLMEIRDALKNK